MYVDKFNKEIIKANTDKDIFIIANENDNVDLFYSPIDNLDFKEIGNPEYSDNKLWKVTINLDIGHYILMSKINDKVKEHITITVLDSDVYDKIMKDLKLIKAVTV